jgi:hypothetical protein
VETYAARVAPTVNRVPLLAAPPSATPAVRGGKRRLVVIGVVVVAAFAGVGAWAAARPGSYGQSRAGCVTVTVPSSTGGGLLHECGAGARAMCARALSRHDPLSMLIRPQCRRAGLG